VFHVINRGVRRWRLFDQPGEYRLFLDLMREAYERFPVRILAYCLMPNHFHLVLWPSTDNDMRQFMHWLTGTHARRWHLWRGSTGTGPVYQGRFRAIPVQTETHLQTVCRYVERNALRAGLVTSAEEWAFSSLHQRDRGRATVPLAEWPIPRPPDWLARVNREDNREELDALRAAFARGVPVGEPEWQKSTAERLGVPLIPGKGGRPRTRKPKPGIGFQPELRS
jgi:putative transposase